MGTGTGTGVCTAVWIGQAQVVAGWAGAHVHRDLVRTRIRRDVYVQLNAR